MWKTCHFIEYILLNYFTYLQHLVTSCIVTWLNILALSLEPRDLNSEL